MGVTIYPSAKTWEEKLAPPAPLIKEVNEKNGYDRTLPTPDNDGSYIYLPPSSSGSSVLERYNASGTRVWSVAGTDINAAVDGWTGVFWLDTSDSAIWVWAYDTSTSPDTYYLAKVALSDGTITNIGSCQPGDGLFSGNFYSYYSERASMGSGNLTIRDGDYKIVLSTTDGSIVTAASQVTQNSAPINAACSYETSDGDIYVAKMIVSDSSSQVTINRGGTYRTVFLPPNCPGTISNAQGYAMLWGGYVAIVGTGNYVVYNGRFFERSSFDSWLTKVADYYGFPT